MNHVDPVNPFDGLPLEKLPIGERVMIAIIEQLQTISVANGYYTELGASIYRARRAFDDEELPAASVFEDSEVPNAGGVSGTDDSFQASHGVRVELSTWSDRAHTGAWLSAARADVKRCLMGWAKGFLGGDEKVGVRDAVGQIGILAYFGSDIVLQPDGAVTEAVDLRFTVQYPEGYGDPTSEI
jgi:hypothetical protein